MCNVKQFRIDEFIVNTVCCYIVDGMTSQLFFFEILYTKMNH